MKGITFIEVVILILIALIVLAVAIPNYQAYRDRVDADQSTEELRIKYRD